MNAAKHNTVNFFACFVLLGALSACDLFEDAEDKVWHVSTFVGNRVKVKEDGPGHLASFNQPTPVVHSADMLYVVTRRDSIRTIAKSTARIQTIRLPVDSFCPAPLGLAISPDGKILYVSDSSNGRVRIINFTDASKTARDLVGINDPEGLAVSPDEKTLYVVDSSNHRIRAIDIATKMVINLATKGNKDGLGTAAKFNRPRETSP